MTLQTQFTVSFVCVFMTMCAHEDVCAWPYVQVHGEASIKAGCLPYSPPCFSETGSLTKPTAH